MKITHLPFASVKSLMPPPTVSGTKTFSEVYLNTYNSKQIKIKEQNQHVTFEVKTKVLVSHQNINAGYLMPLQSYKPAALANRQEGSL